MSACTPASAPKPRDIAPGLRLPGAFLSLYLKQTDVRVWRAYQSVLEALFVGRSSKDMQCGTVHVPPPHPGMPAIRTRIYRPLYESAAPVPVVLWLHGGGYATGVPEMDTLLIKKYIRATGCVVVAPDYRLSPDAPYPAGLADVYAVLLWIRDNAVRLHIRRDQIFVAGSSSGGGMTAALCLYARDRGEVRIAFQMPLYPMLDDRPTPSSRANNAPIWDTRMNRHAWRLYRRALSPSQETPIYCAPARADDLSALPPFFSFVGDLEPFLDETAAYVRRLRAAGVPCRFAIYRGCYHAFDRFSPFTRPSRHAAARSIDALRYATRHFYAEN